MHPYPASDDNSCQKSTLVLSFKTENARERNTKQTNSIIAIGAPVLWTTNKNISSSMGLTQVAQSLLRFTDNTHLNFAFEIECDWVLRAREI